MSTADEVKTPDDLARLREVWTALGCEQNPNDFHAEVQASMWENALTVIRESTSGDHRIARENRMLEAELTKVARERDDLARAVEGVRAVHVRVTGTQLDGEGRFVPWEHCKHELLNYPCLTIRALDQATVRESDDG